jgi:hypothetical protein
MVNRRRNRARTFPGTAFVLPDRIEEQGIPATATHRFEVNWVSALFRAIPGPDTEGEGGGIAARHRTDHIVEVLTASGAEMSTNDVISALHGTGRPHQTYDYVRADLAYLVERGRIARVRRGVYAAIDEPQAEPDRIVIPLTQGNINNNHV